MSITNLYSGSSWHADHGRVPVFFVVDPSETFSRDPEPSKLPLTYGSGVSEGSTTKKTGQGKSKKNIAKSLLLRARILWDTSSI